MIGQVLSYSERLLHTHREKQQAMSHNKEAEGQNDSRMWFRKAPRQLVEYSPLSLAVKGNHADAVRVLLDHNADPSYVDGSGRSPYERVLEVRVYT